MKTELNCCKLGVKQGVMKKNSLFHSCLIIFMMDATIKDRVFRVWEIPLSF